MTDERVLKEGDIHDILRNERRRHTLELLRDNGDTLSVRQLSERVAALETGESPPPRNIRQSVYVSLHQTHLPKLDELGIVGYDADAKQVTLLDRVGEVEAYMGRPVTPDSRTSHQPVRSILALSLVGIVVMGAVAFNAPVLAAIGAPVLGILLFLSVSVIAARHLYPTGDDPDADRTEP